MPTPGVASAQLICIAQYTNIGAAAVSGHTYNWSSNPSGFTSTAANPSVSPSVATTYYLTESITATGCSASDSVKVNVNPLPTATTGGNHTICYGQSISIGGTAVSGNTYAWSSHPTGYSSTSSNPSVSPTVTTTYILTETVNTGCTKTDSATITVNPIPSATVGSPQTICNTSSVTLGAASVVGNTYSWTSNPSGFTSTTSNPSVSPGTTTTYKLTETITATGCSKSDSVKISVNPLPSIAVGSPQTICQGVSTSIGSAALSGNTYSWTSIPGGFTSTAANPSVSPSTTTSYKLKQTISATGCTTSDSVLITVNPIPSATVGSATAICNGSSITLGASAVVGNTYTWTSNPSGYSSSVSNPSVSPSATTVYKLTEKITATGCSKSDSVKITVNPLPAANVGSPATICYGDSVQIGASAVAGNTYAWTSKSGWTSGLSHPYVSPFNTNTYYLTETISATGCKKSDSVIITVTPIPSRPSFAANNGPLCVGDSLKLSSGTVLGASYTWTGDNGKTYYVQNPKVGNITLSDTGWYGVKVTVSGCTSANRYTYVTINSRPSPSISGNGTVCGNSIQKYGAGTTGNSYFWRVNGGTIVSGQSTDTVSVQWSTLSSGTVKLIETNTNGCNDSTTKTININALPSANVGSPSTICAGNTASIGSSAIAGNTYSWTSRPSGYSSSNSSNMVSPGATTVYKLTETISATGCSKTDSVSVTVNPLPSAGVGSATAICSGSSTTIGASAVAGHTYSWTSNPSGFTSALANPSVSPLVNTTYKLTETISATGCTKSDSVKISVNALPTVSAGSAATICYGDSTQIGTPAVAGNTYAWTSKSGWTSTQAQPYVSPFSNNTYYLTETISASGCHASDSVVITVTPLPTRPPFINNNGPLCTNDTLKLIAGTVSGATYKWTGDNGKTYFVQNPVVPNITLADTGLYGVQSIVSGCYSASRYTYVRIYAQPTPSISGNTTVCGATTQKYAAGTTTNSYYWRVSGGTIISGKYSDTVKVLWGTGSTGTVKLIETNPNTCIDSTTITVNLNTLPSANVGSASAICLGNSASIGSSATLGHTYSWTSNPSGYTSSNSSNSVSPTVSTMYKLTEVNTLTGCTNTDSVLITVNPLPSANVGTNNTVCKGSSLIIGASAVSGNTYSWTSNPSGFSSTVSNPSVSPTGNTTYYLTEKVSATGCTKSDSIVVNVNAIPSVSVGSAATICYGDSAQIGSTAVAGISYSWTSRSGWTSTLANPYVAPYSTNTYYLTESYTSTGCSNSDSVQITVTPLPTRPSFVNNNGPLCTGDTLKLTAGTVSGATYKWTGDNGKTYFVQNPIVAPVRMADTGWYGVQSVMSGCASPSRYTYVKITKRTTPGIVGVNAICAGNTTKYAATDTGNTYHWIITGGYISKGWWTDTITVVWNTAGTGTVKLKEGNNNGCIDSTTLSVTVNALPSASVISSTAICSGNSINIGATAIAGHTYSWTSNPSGFTSSSSNPSVSPTVMTLYKLTETNTLTGCSNADSLLISINPLPAANVGTNNAVCNGSSITIGATAYSGNTYSWTSNPTGFTSTSSNPSVSPTVNTTYYLTETVGSTGCTKSDSLVVTVNPLPSASVGSPATICYGDSVQIGATAVSGHTYYWTSKSGWISFTANPYVSPYATNTYYLLETNTATGCSKTDSVVITVNAPVSRPSFATNNGPLCTNDSLKLTAGTVSGATYAWTGSNGFTSTSQNPIISGITLADTGWYGVRAEVGGCYSAYRYTYVRITKRTSPKITGITSICVGGVTKYAAGDTGNTYNWIVTGGYVSKGLWTDTVTVVWSKAGAGSIKLREGNNNGCIDSTILAVNVHALPVANAGSSSTICAGTTINIGSTGTAGDKYSWTSNPIGFTDTTSNPAITPAYTTKYYLKETTPFGCTAMDSIKVTVNPSPSPAFISGSNVCIGTTAVYKTSKTPGSSFVWTATNGTIVSGGTSDSVTVNWNTSGAGSIQVKETNSSGCSDSFSASVNVIALPTPMVSGIDSVCIYSTLGYKANGSSGSTFSWKAFGGSIISGSGTDSIGVNWTSAGSGYVEVTETNTTGCSNTYNYTVHVHNLPTPAIVGNTQACTGNTSIYQTTRNAGSKYKWSIKGGTISYNGGDSIHVSWGPTGTGTLTVVENNAYGCSDSASAMITINALPKPAISGASSSCVNSYAIYRSTTVNSGSSYYWNISGGSIIAGTNADSVIVNWGTGSTGSISLSETNASGCSDSVKLNVTLNAAPNVNFGVSKACFGTASKFTDSSSAHLSQVWYFGDGDTSITLNASHTYSQPGTYSAKLFVVNASGCINMVSKTVLVDSITNAHFSSSTNGFYYTYKADDSTRAPGSYTWNFGDGSASASGAKVKHTYAKDSTYLVSLTTVNPNGCSNTFDSLMSIIYGIENPLANVSNLNIYPNPFNQFTTLSFDLTQTSKVKISVYGLDGKEIATLADQKLDLGNHQFRFNPEEYNAVQGVYIVRIIVNESYTTRQIIRVK